MADAGKPRLLVLASTYPRWSGDSEPGFVHELARRLTDQFDVSVITPHARGAKRREVLDGVTVQRYRYAPSLLETLVHGGGIMAHLHRAPWKILLVPGFVWAQWFTVRRAIIRQRPQVIHAHWLLPQGVVARLLVRHDVPYVLTSHGADLFALRGRWFTRCRRWVVSKAAATSVVSEAMRERLQAECPDAKIAVMPMGIDARHRFTPDASVVRADNELLFVGRLVEKKGLRHLIEAMPAILAVHPGVNLTVAGFGPEAVSLQARIEDLGLRKSVRLLGAMAQKDLPALYRRAALFVAPFVEARNGDQEGLGLVVAEAMACGCPVVTGEVVGVRDLIGDDTGVIVPATDHAAMAAAMVGLLTDPARRERLAAAGRAHALRHFDWPVVADGYARLLHSLVTGASE